MGSALYPVTARTASKTCDFTALDPARYLRSCALVIDLRAAINSSIGQGDPRHRPTSADTRSDESTRSLSARNARVTLKSVRPAGRTLGMEIWS